MTNIVTTMTQNINQPGLKNAGDPSQALALRARCAIPWEIPSQNVRDRQHWAVRAKAKATVEWLLRCAVNRNPGLRHHGGHVTAVITSYRKRLITDHANLVGGAKGLVDAMAATGMLVDDRDALCSITYEQALMRSAPPWVRLWVPQLVPCTSILILGD